MESFVFGSELESSKDEFWVGVCFSGKRMKEKEQKKLVKLLFSSLNYT